MHILLYLTHLQLFSLPGTCTYNTSQSKHQMGDITYLVIDYLCNCIFLGLVPENKPKEGISTEAVQGVICSWRNKLSDYIPKHSAVAQQVAFRGTKWQRHLFS